MAQDSDSPYPLPAFSEVEHRWLAAEVRGAEDVEVALATVVHREAVIDFIAENGGWRNVDADTQAAYHAAADEVRQRRDSGS